MRLIYILPNGIYPNGSKGADHGVGKKIQSLINGLMKQNIVVDKCELIYSVTNPINFLKSYYISHQILVKIFKESSKSDVLYIRSIYPHISNFICCKTKHNGKVVFELQSIEKTELKSQLNKNNRGLVFHIKQNLLYYSNNLFEKSIKCHADALVSVTNEITEYNRHLTNNKLRYLTLGNGIEVTQIKERNLLNNDTDVIHVLCVAVVALWHGIDRLIRGMHEYSGDKTINLHIVGDGPELQNLKSLTSELHLESHVIFHGFKSGADLDAMFDQCHIAIGGLADFRRGLKEVSLLKNREYCARGIPFVLVAKDIDFPDEWAYTLHVPA
ncbi:glycosyltransferase, partial [Methanocorpusculum sp. GPch4]|uniref:glycosyltransferase n=1 Tax=Methanocorpusculum sp. GPch4 TaxID=2527877 RepID=UPI0014332583